MAVLQYGHRVDAEALTRALASPFRHPALEAVRAVIAGFADRTRPGWAVDAVSAVREPFRSLAAELLTADFPARDEAHAVASAADLTLRLIARRLAAEKTELLGAIQRVPPDSEEGRRLRLRLRELDGERLRLTEPR